MYQAAAQGLASLGRGQDKMLVHMTPGEVGGLQQLAMAHGGSLTVNPHTGLPEAGFLSSILPTVAGAALMATPLGPALGPLGVAGLIGGGSYLLNPKQGLMGGLMAGLGAYGGAGLGSALGGFGQEALNTAADSAQGLATGMQDPLMASAVNADTLAQAQAAAEATKTAAANPSITEKMGAGLGAAFADPTGFYKTLNKDMGKWGLAAAATPLVLSAARSAMQPGTLNAPALKPSTFYSTSYTPMRYDPVTGKYVNGYYGSGTYGPTFTAAKGGLAGLDDTDRIPAIGQASKAAAEMYKDEDDDRPLKGTGPALLSALAKGAKNPLVQGEAIKEIYARATNDAPYIQNPYSEVQAANGGLMQALQGMHPGAKIPSTYAAGGKLLRGPGDGMSDSIPAVIEGAKPQRAALADGEFVIPADVVSHLGNGSTEAGSRHLYNMMDRVRKARTGNVKQGRQIRPEKYMPA